VGVILPCPHVDTDEEGAEGVKEQEENPQYKQEDVDINHAVGVVVGVVGVVGAVGVVGHVEWRRGRLISL